MALAERCRGWLALPYGRADRVASLLISGAAMMAFNRMLFREGGLHTGQAPAGASVLGGIFATAGIALRPINKLWTWAWAPLFLRFGGLPMFVVARY